MSNLSFYLQKIAHNEHINYAQFATLCTKHQLNAWQRVFQFDHLGKQKYRVTVLDLAQFQQWYAIYVQPTRSRISAAQAGNSHQAATNFAYLLRRTDKADTQSTGSIDCVWLAKDLPPPPNHFPNALLVENLENFGCIPQMRFVVADWFPKMHLANVDWLFAAGNQISNAHHKAYLQQYQRLDCLFDWDIGGLRIFQNLRLMLPEQALYFALPPDPSALLSQSQRKLTTKQRSELVSFAHLSPQTDLLIKCMLKYNRAVEQEIYLSESAQGV